MDANRISETPNVVKTVRSLFIFYFKSMVKYKDVNGEKVLNIIVYL